jgi:hypothetical protein
MVLSFFHLRPIIRFPEELCREGHDNNSPECVPVDSEYVPATRCFPFPSHPELFQSPHRNWGLPFHEDSQLIPTADSERESGPCGRGRVRQAQRVLVSSENVC